MVSNQVLAARVAASLLVLCVGLGGCAHTRQTPQATPSAAPAASSGSATAAPVPEQQTATEAAVASAGAGPAPSVSETETGDIIKPGAPMHYTVKQGDTLWGIASMYLKDPWLWPEVWILNPQVPNPHLIYPGDTLALAYGADGRPHVMVEKGGEARLEPRLRSSPLDTSIPTIPYSAIAAFLSRPTVMTSEQMHHAPYVLAFRDLHQIAGSGIEAYVRNTSAGQNARFAVVHIANTLRDPDDGAVVGYEGIYTATALVQRGGDPARALLIDPARETLAGDRLLSVETETPITFTLRTPSSEVHGRIIDVVGGTDLVGQWQVVVINRGKRHGLEPGDMLAVDEAGDTCRPSRCTAARDIYRNGSSIIGSTSGFSTDFAPVVKLPSERVGTLLVFRVFDRVSYGLIVGASDTIHVYDLVGTP
jgi:LysM repeat protein